ncbi:MAG: hypothetical protein KME47_09795 [Nodosilinea sp. WJT8-NPBG4]|jgi:hypothetical protein|nr:hypothetical protein [Nodosilinea sp. WJT8-NPBG4]
MPNDYIPYSDLLAFGHKFNALLKAYAEKEGVKYDLMDLFNRGVKALEYAQAKNKIPNDATMHYAAQQWVKWIKEGKP